MILGILKILIVVFTALFAIFRFRDSYQTNDEKNNLKFHYSQIWLGLEKTLVYQLPVIITGKLIELETRSNRIIKYINRSKWFATDGKSFPYIMIIILLALFFLDDIFPDNGELVEFLKTAGSEIIIIIALLKMFAGDDYDNESVFRSRLFNAFVFYSVTIVASIFLTGLVLFLEGKLELPIRNKLIIYVVNCSLDILTVFFTFMIFKRIVAQRQSSLYYIVAVLIDFIWAGALAFFSLYLITQFTNITVSSTEIFYTLIGMSPETNDWQINEWFWLVHSTFIPTLIFLFAVLFGVFSKVVVIPIGKLFGKAGVLEKPDYMFATLFAVLASLLIVIVFLMEL